MAGPFLSARQARERAASIREALQSILASPALVGRPQAAQWRFFAATAGLLIGDESPPEFTGLAPTRAAQLKFEVEDRLRRFYLNPGQPIRLVFSLVHVSKLAALGLDPQAGPPALAGYVALVRDVGEDLEALCEVRELPAYLERVIADAIDAEFAAYAALPTIDEAALARHFVADGPAFLGVMHVLVRHRERGWILTNPLNPSTKRLLTVRIDAVQPPTATARTTEYFYLRWWDAGRHKYAYAYREINTQRYVLERGDDGVWRVLDNLRPSPRLTPPNRRIRLPSSRE